MGWLPIKAAGTWHVLCLAQTMLGRNSRKDKDNWCEATRQLMEQLGLEKYWRNGFFGLKETWRDIVRERVRMVEQSKDEAKTTGKVFA